MTPNKKKILIIEDETATAQLISDFCESFGCKTMMLNSGEDALNVVKSFHPDMITLDLLMDDPTGLEVLEVLKSDEETVSIPVVIISAIASSFPEKFLKKSQAILSKPLRLNMLKQTIENTIHHSH